MARLWRLNGGDPFPQAGDGDTVLLAAGGRAHSPFSLRGARDVRIESDGDAPARIDGRGAAFGIRVHDGSDGLTLKRVRVEGAAHGVKITGSDHVLVSDCEFNDCGVEGLLAGGCEDLCIADCSSAGNGRGGVRGYREDQGHGFYVSWGSRRVQLLRCVARENRGSGIQLNGTPAQGTWLEEARLEGCDLWANGSCGTPGLALMAVRDCRVLECALCGNNAGIVLYDDGVPGFSPQSVRFEGVTLHEPHGKFALRLIGNCQGIELVDCRVVTGRPEAVEGNPASWRAVRCDFLVGDRGRRAAKGRP